MAMNKNNGWIGIDLDGTLAKYNGFKGAEHIGEPIPRMLKLVKKLIKEGKYEVKIFTARVDGGAKSGQEDFRNVNKVRSVIQDWCEKHIGQRLDVTNEKDYGMIKLYDDRVVQVIPNTGVCLEDMLKELVQLATKRAYKKAISDVAKLLKETHK